MARDLKYNLNGGVPGWAMPCGVCPACGRYCFAMHQSESLCPWCGQANFVHRGKFEWKWCACRWEDPFCATCWGKGVVPVPKSAENGSGGAK